MRRILILLVLIGLSGCGGGNPPVGPQDVTGTEGIVVIAVDDEYEVFEEEEFSLLFEVYNRGSYPVTREKPGRFFVSYDKLYFYLDQVFIETNLPEDGFALAERTPYYDGEEALVPVTLKARAIARNSDEIHTPVTLTACFPYKTIQPINVCIQQARRVNEGSVVCKNQELRPPAPGAPLSVTSVTTRTSNIDDGFGGSFSSPVFRITVENHEDGISSILNDDVPSVSSCNAEPGQQQLNGFRFSAKLLETPLDCSTIDGKAGFVRGEAVITCKLDSQVDASRFANQANFQSILTVEMEYFYRSSATTNVVIVR